MMMNKPKPTLHELNAQNDREIVRYVIKFLSALVGLILQILGAVYIIEKVF